MVLLSDRIYNTAYICGNYTRRKILGCWNNHGVDSQGGLQPTLSSYMTSGPGAGFVLPEDRKQRASLEVFEIMMGLGKSNGYGGDLLELRDNSLRSHEIAGKREWVKTGVRNGFKARPLNWWSKLLSEIVPENSPE